ncbi:MAG: antirestriction protein [Ignavibacteriae bacterium]|nr:MAG: antirestriction protein [Ignavibacteriota bacterium]
MLARVKEVLDTLLSEFKNGTIPEAVAYAMFPIPNIPSASWSMLNRLMMFFHGTEDARGYRQWQAVGRQVKKGSHSFDILVPVFIKQKSETADNEITDEKTILKGFCCGCVFKVEDTEGKPLDYQKLVVPQFPLIEKAKALGVEIHATGGNDAYNGYYDPRMKIIALATPEEKTFFHELCHAVDHKLKGTLKRGQDPVQEITAELAAQALCRIVGKDGSRHFGNTYRYIESYAKDLSITPQAAVIQVLSEVDAILKYLLQGRQVNSV